MKLIIHTYKPNGISFFNYLFYLNKVIPLYKSSIFNIFLFFGCYPNILYECDNLIFKNHYSISPP